MAFDKDKQTAMETALRNTVAIVTGEKAKQAGLNITMEANQCVDAANKLRQGIYEVMMLGIFSTGKSTVINALLGKSVLPDSVRPCTAIITKLQYSTEKNGQVDVIMKDGGVVNYTYDNFKEKYQYTDDDEKEFKAHKVVKRFTDVSYAIVYSNLGILQNGVQIVDTPGLKNNSQDNFVSMSEAKKSNAKIFLLSSDRNFDEDEKKHIAENFAGKKLSNVFFLITKFDYLKKEKDRQDTRNRTRTELDKVFRDSSGNFDEELYSKRVFFVSALDTLTYREEKKGNEDVEFSKFEKELEVFLENDEKAHQVYKDNLACIATAYQSTQNYKKLLQATQRSTASDFEQKAKKILTEIESAKAHVKSLETVFSSTKAACNAVIERELSGCIIALKDGWPAKLEELNQQDKFGVLDVGNIALQNLGAGAKKVGGFVKSIFTGEDYDEIASKIDKETEEKITEIIQPLMDDVIDYIKGGYDNVGKDIKSSIEKHAKNLAASIDSVTSEVDKIAQDFNININIGGESMTNTKVDMVKFVIAAILGDYSHMTTLGSGEETEWGEFIGRVVKQLLVDLIGYAIFGPIGFLVVEFIQLMNGTEDRQKQFYKNIFQSGITATEYANSRLIDDWRNHINTNFNSLQNNVVNPLNQKLMQLEDTWRNLEAEKNDSSSTFGVKINTVDNIATSIFENVETALSGSLSEIVSIDDFKRMI